MALTKCKECGKEVSNLAKACPHCGIKNPGTRAKDVIVGIFVLIAAAWLVAKCTSSNETPVPKTIQEISKEISAVSNENGVLRITLAGKAVLRSKDVMQNASMDAHRIAEGIVRHFPSSLGKQVIFVANAEVQDRYGKMSMAPVFEFQYKADDLRKIDFSGLYHKQMLELAAPLKYLSLAGAEVVVEWCKDEDNRSTAKRFCFTNAR